MAIRKLGVPGSGMVWAGIGNAGAGIEVGLLDPGLVGAGYGLAHIAKHRGRVFRRRRRAVARDVELAPKRSPEGLACALQATEAARRG